MLGLQSPLKSIALSFATTLLIASASTAFASGSTKIMNLFIKPEASGSLSDLYPAYSSTVTVTVAVANRHVTITAGNPYYMNKWQKLVHISNDNKSTAFTLNTTTKGYFYYSFQDGYMLGIHYSCTVQIAKAKRGATHLINGYNIVSGIICSFNPDYSSNGNMMPVIHYKAVISATSATTLQIKFNAPKA